MNIILDKVLISKLFNATAVSNYTLINGDALYERYGYGNDC